MKTTYSAYRILCTLALLTATPLLAGADGSGCSSGGRISVGSGNPSPTGDGGACTQADCAGLPALADAKNCPGYDTAPHSMRGDFILSRSVCAKSSSTGLCEWDFPACPATDAGAACVCAGPAPGAPSGVCADGSAFGPICFVNPGTPIPGMSSPPVTCSWALRSCTDAAVCPQLGCFPQCPNGVVKDPNGCDTCQCEPAADGGTPAEAGSGHDASGPASCAPSDCAGLAALADAKVCPDGTSLGRSVCAKSTYTGQCEWDFPACPPLEAGVACSCPSPAPSAPNGLCADGSLFGPACVVNTAPPIPGMAPPPVTCSWTIRTCSPARDAGSSSGAASCDARKAAALATVQIAVDANGTCTVDADCRVVAFQSGCFDACTRVVNAAGVAAVQSAESTANANGCATFASDGCALSIPPCLPPGPPTCVGGKCM